MSKFRNRKYTWTRPYSATRHEWQVVGPIGAVSFSASIMDDAQYEPTCGLEFHHTQRAGHIYPISQEAPHHSPCHILGEPCWHDGTSLYAFESVWPQVQVYLRGGEHEQIFKILEWEYVRHFEQKPEQ